MISLMDKQKIIIDGFLGGKSQWAIHRETRIVRKQLENISENMKKKELCYWREKEIN